MTTQLPSTQELTLSIRGMTCAGCVASVQQALSKLPGVSDAVVPRPHPHVTKQVAGSRLKVEG